MVELRVTKTYLNPFNMGENDRMSLLFHVSQDEYRKF